MSRTILGVCLTFLLAIPSMSLAVADAGFAGPFQYSETDGFALLENDRWDRYLYTGVGARFDIIVERDVSYPADGDRWYLGLDRPSTGQRLGKAYVEYDGDLDCLIFNGSQILQCNIVGQFSEDKRLEFYFYATTIYFTLNCFPTEDYHLTTEEDLAASARREFDGSPFEFRPTRFKPSVQDNVFLPYNLKPKKWKGDEAGQAGDVVAIVEDDQECNIPLEGVKVRIASNPLPFTNGKPYVTSEQVGFGKFIDMGFDSTINPDGDHQAETVIEGFSNSQGFYKARYQAQDHGAAESLRFDLSRPETEIDPPIENVPPFEEFITLSFPGLKEIVPTADIPVGFADGGSCPHNPLPHWVTPSTHQKFMSIASLYHRVVGRIISVNDASLPLGGAIANKTDDFDKKRAALCHVSHRFGIDIDINGTDRALDGSDGKSMYTETVLVNGYEYTVLDWLTDTATSFGAEKVEEEPIHYRFPR